MQRDEGRTALPPHDRRRRNRRVPTAARRRSRHLRTARRRLRRDLRIAPAGSRRVLPARDAVRLAGGHAQRAAAGVRRDAVVEAALSLFRASLARGRCVRTCPARGAPSRPQSRLAALRRERHPVDAGQVGIPVVRGVGHGVPCRPARDDRPGVREEPAAPADARVVHAPERADPRLRVVVRRRQPAGARVGRHPRLPDRGEDVRPERPRLSRARVPEAHDQFHVVGEPQGRRRQQHLRRRLPGSRQHRRVRPFVRTAVGGAARAGRRDELDGDVLPQSAGDFARARARRIPSTRTSRPNSSSTSSTSARPSIASGAARAACGTTTTASITMR